MTNLSEIRQAVSDATVLQSKVEAQPRFQRKGNTHDIPADLSDGEYVAKVESFWNAKTDHKGSKKIAPCKQMILTVGLYDKSTREYLGDKSVWLYGSVGDFGEVMRNNILQALKPDYDKSTAFDDIDKKSFVGKTCLCSVVHHGGYTNLTGWKALKTEEIPAVKTATQIKGAPDVWWDSLTVEQKEVVMAMVTTCNVAFGESTEKETPAQKPETLQVKQPDESSSADDAKTDLQDYTGDDVPIDVQIKEDPFTGRIITPEDLPF